MQLNSDSQLVLAEPVRPAQPQAPAWPKNASHLLVSQAPQSDAPVSLHVALQAGVKFLAGVLGGSHSSLA